MKKVMLSITGVLLFVLVFSSGGLSPEKRSTIDKSSIEIVCSPDLYNLVGDWISEYGHQNPEVKIHAKPVNEKDFNYLLQNGYVGFVSGNYSNQYSLNPDAFKIVIGRDIMVPVINTDNPAINQINETGMKLESLTQLFTGNQKPAWSDLYPGATCSPIKIFTTNNDAEKSMLAGFFRTKTLPVDNYFNNGKELITYLQHNPSGIGFSRVKDLIDPQTGELYNHIRLLPIDKNNNGKLDYFENFYGNLNDFNRAVWIGKYPSKLISNIYTISNKTYTDPSVSAFLSWIITDGQFALNNYGFNELILSERQSKLDKILNRQLTVGPENESYASSNTLIWIALAALIVIIALVFIYRFQGKKEILNQKIAGEQPRMVEATMLHLPKGLYFDKTHTWAFMEKDGIVKIGIDDFLQHITGEYTSVRMKAPGQKIKKREQILTLIKDGKQLNIYSPVSGTIKMINEELVTDPSLINEAPYEEGWLYEIEPSNWLREIQFMKMAEKHKDWLQYEFSRLKDFLARTINVKSSKPELIMLQEGGGIVDHVLGDLSPQVWEDFQKNFIDNSELK